MSIVNSISGKKFRLMENATSFVISIFLLTTLITILLGTLDYTYIYRNSIGELIRSIPRLLVLTAKEIYHIFPRFLFTASIIITASVMMSVIAMFHSLNNVVKEHKYLTIYNLAGIRKSSFLNLTLILPSSFMPAFLSMIPLFVPAMLMRGLWKPFYELIPMEYTTLIFSIFFVILLILHSQFYRFSEKATHIVVAVYIKNAVAFAFIPFIVLLLYQFPGLWDEIIGKWILMVLILSFFDGNYFDIYTKYRSELSGLLNSPWILSIVSRNVPLRKHLVRHLKPTFINHSISKIISLFSSTVVLEIIIRPKIGLGQYLSDVLIDNFGTAHARTDQFYASILAIVVIFVFMHEFFKYVQGKLKYQYAG